MNKLRMLLATDYSAASINAGCYALGIAKEIEAELILTHAYIMSMGSIPVDAKEFAKARAQIKNRELRALEQQKNELLQECNVSEQDIDVTCIIHETGIGVSIQEEISNHKPDIVIAGTHGHGMNRIKFFGNNAWDIIKHSSVPVLLVPPNVKFHNITRIVIAVEGRENEIKSINSLTKIAGLLNAEIIVLHISSKVLSNDLEHTMFEKFRIEVFKNVMYSKLSVQLAVYDNLLEGLNNYCEKINANWLVMSPDRNSIFRNIFMPFKSATKKMSSKTQIPLLALPAYQEKEEQHIMNVEARHPNL